MSVLLNYQVFLLSYVFVGLHMLLHFLGVDRLVEITDFLQLFLALNETWDLIGLLILFFVNFIERFAFLLDFSRPSLTNFLSSL